MLDTIISTARKNHVNQAFDNSFNIQVCSMKQLILLSYNAAPLEFPRPSNAHILPDYTRERSRNASRVEVVSQNARTAELPHEYEN